MKKLKGRTIYFSADQRRLLLDLITMKQKEMKELADYCYLIEHDPGEGDEAMNLVDFLAIVKRKLEMQP